MRPRNRGLVSRQVWHDKDPSLIKGHERQVEIYSVHPFDNDFKIWNDIFSRGQLMINLWNKNWNYNNISIWKQYFPIAQYVINIWNKSWIYINYINHSIFNNKEKKTCLPLPRPFEMRTFICKPNIMIILIYHKRNFLKVNQSLDICNEFRFIFQKKVSSTKID